VVLYRNCNTGFLSFIFAEHRILAAQLAKCRFCFENPDIAKHLIIAIGLKVAWKEDI